MPTGRLGLPAKAGLLAAQLATRADRSQVVFGSFGGRFSDNPRAVYEELVRRGAEQRHVWVAEPGVALPEGTTGVEPGTARYAREVGRSRTVVTNAAMTHYVKRPGTTYLQTWHGTPLKRIGYDNPRYAADRDGLRRAVRDYRRWDLLLSQNAFSTEVFRRAFRFDGEVLETGYPRNDVLSSPGRDALRAQVRSALGVADDVLLVLYAPTFRDDEVQSGVRSPLPLDLARMADALGDRVHVLTRLHHRDTARLAAPPSPFWRSASEHPDIRELYLAADVLVTDYSSAMFDFAVTGKPILLFTYDLERYRDAVRGFYFDLEEQAPGPLCRTTDELVTALEDLPAAQAAHATAYARFRERYCSLDDGGAAERVVDRLLRDH